MPNVKTLRISGGGTYPHPSKQYENARVDISYEIELEPGDDLSAVEDEFMERAENRSTAFAEVILDRR